ncbi:MAG: DNA mismatch repair protein MutS [Deltaproteobacteria bacterium]|nr:DNA mismatch repair protein MutS [Deltaproteobacteria bacterium]
MAASAPETPLMRQYLEIKGQHPDAVVFFQLGDFYEMFFEDAVLASQALELTLTSRDKNKDDPVPMCGVPIHAAKGYARKLLDLGHKVAVCDQIEDPRLARGIVRRQVTQVMTPGLILDADHLDAKTNNYLVVLSGAAGGYGLAALDLSTFELRVTELEGDTALLDELGRLRPKELLYAPGLAPLVRAARSVAPGTREEETTSLFGDPATDAALLDDRCGASWHETSATGMSVGRGAAAAALRYAARSLPGYSLPSCRLLPYRPREHLQLDEAALRHLEIFESNLERRREGSLLSIMDLTLTAMGGRALRRELASPLLDVGAIRRRHDAVELLLERRELRQELRRRLREIYDLERLTARVVVEQATPRELGRLGLSLGQLPELGRLLREGVAQDLARELPEPLRLPEDHLEDLAGRIGSTLVDDPPIATGEGGLVRPGVNAELDALVHLCEGGKAELIAVEARERERTGIQSLKVRYNKVFGYYIEVTRANLKNVPHDYQRKQTVANAERFVTAELADYEARLLTAEERRGALERQLFEELRGAVARQERRLTAVAERVALLDVLCALAELAERRDYVRPEIDDGTLLELKDARHPVVEAALPVGEYVPNDISLDAEGERLLIITGPNMAGKSTALRQVALAVIMGQVGSFVPCRSARLGVVDRVFTRVGAGDNLARGESTFMVEMRETAAILRHATPRSLVVLDEIGRGTSTYDGLSIAWAVAEFLHDEIRARSLFATHYHELCLLPRVKPHAVNLSVAVEQWNDRVVFLRRLVPGGASRSYGIEVARLAGLRPEVVARARQVLAALEGKVVVDDLPLQGRVAETVSDQLALFAAGACPSGGPARAPASAGSEVERELRQLDVNRLTPLEALNILADLAARTRPTAEN